MDKNRFLSQASAELDTSSRRKMSLSLYKELIMRSITRPTSLYIYRSLMAQHRVSMVKVLKHNLQNPKLQNARNLKHTVNSNVSFSASAVVLMHSADRAVVACTTDDAQED